MRHLNQHSLTKNLQNMQNPQNLIKNQPSMKPLSPHRKRITMLLLLRMPILLHSITITRLHTTALLRKAATAAPIMADSDKK
jgi:hypothetical protein